MELLTWGIISRLENKTITIDLTHFDMYGN